ncbi:hypothetical protein DPEC_G00042270 [Dallia pectoralis]|uniref:Uncharacterized protein n=1 Tax=Dallia pectoralis TaxID=75939 RepID=A0ACC2H984_DALPE|nr:hypothetical protein DPEC_G00042270 [Dallia pectoralis]
MDQKTLVTTHHHRTTDTPKEEQQEELRKSLHLPEVSNPTSCQEFHVQLEYYISSTTTKASDQQTIAAMISCLSGPDLDMDYCLVVCTPNGAGQLPGVHPPLRYLPTSNRGRWVNVWSSCVNVQEQPRSSL